MRPPCEVIGALLIALAVGGSASAVSGRSAADCLPVIVALDTSLANNTGGAYLGKAPGQTFLAADTLIRSITVWRAAVEDTDYVGMHLYITPTDSTGAPEPDKAFYDGPTVYNYFGDGVHPIPFQFVLDPPAVLPGPGLYAFFLKQEPCLLYFDVIGRDNTGGDDVYPAGHFWETRRSDLSGCILRPLADSYPTADLIFSIEFCQTKTTPTLGRTWGAVKVHYR